MVRRLVVGVAVVLATLGAVMLLWTGPTMSAEPDGLQSPLTSPDGFANAEFEIRVYRNGSARWAIRATRPLENQSDIERFRSFADTFESTETDAFRNFRLRAQRLVAFGTNTTDREMNAISFGRDARVVELGQTRGVVELSFLWTNFARTDGDRVVVGDVFQGGMFVDSGQRLVIARGPELAFEGVSDDPPPDSQSVEGNLTASETVTWFGEQDFPDQRPRAVLIPPGSASDDTPAGTRSGTSMPSPATGDSSGMDMLPFIFVAVILLGLVGGFALYSGAVGNIRFPGRESPETENSTQSKSGKTPPADAVSAIPDEDRVLQLLEENGGRMKQVDIVDETDWSKSKVSMLLSDMQEDGQISKLRVGRENIISKAGEEPDAAGSPFEEE
ncbi:MAG: helix-turn-helix domain-containing protein [Haloarculaceae archaeon]